MIITELKSLEEITDAIKDYHNILIAACGGCTTVHKTGGRKEAEALKAALEKGKAKFESPLCHTNVTAKWSSAHFNH